MDTNKHSGFTIIEVSLVLAVASLMLVMMMTGVTLAVQRQRFSDSVNGSQSYLQQQFNYTQNTINDREESSCNPGDPGNGGSIRSIRGASDCVIIGKLLEIVPATGSDESVISSFDVVAAKLDTEDPAYSDKSELELLQSIKPTAIKQAAPDSSYIVPWGAQISALRDANETGVGPDVRYIALLRSLRSGALHVYRVDEPNSFANSGDTTKRLTPVNIKEFDNPSVKMCINSVDLIGSSAMLEIKPTGSQDGIVTHFDDAQKEAYRCGV